MSTPITSALIDPNMLIAEIGDGGIRTGLENIDAQLDASNPTSLAFAQAGATAFYGELMQFRWTGSPFFDVDSDSAPMGEEPITDFDLIDTDIVRDPDVDADFWAWDPETGLYQNNVLGTHVTRPVLEVEAERVGGGGGIEIQFFLRVDAGIQIFGRKNKLFNALNDKIGEEFVFPLVLIPSGGSTISFIIKPLTGGVSTMRFTKYIVSLTPERAG